MAYGKIKADTFVYDNSGSDVEVTLASLGNKAGLNSPTFTGTPVVPGYAPLAGATFTGNVVMSANLTVQGTTTTISSTTINVADKNIEIGKVSTPTDTTADGGGITLKGATDKTWNWVDATDAWTSSEHIHLGDSKKVIFGAGSDLEIHHDSSSNDSIIDNNTGDLFITTTGSADDIFIQSNDDLIIKVGNGQDGIKVIGDGAVELYNNGTKKFATEGGNNAARLWGNVVIRSAADNVDVAVFSDDGTNRVCNLYANGTKRFETTTSGVTVTGTVSDSKGDVRKIIQNSQSSAYTLVAADSGKHVITDSAVTIPNSIFAAGDAVTIVNNSGSDIALTKSITNLYLSTDGSNASRTLAARGMATILFVSGTAAYISGAGLS